MCHLWLEGHRDWNSHTREVAELAEAAYGSRAVIMLEESLHYCKSQKIAAPNTSRKGRLVLKVLTELPAWNKETLAGTGGGSTVRRPAEGGHKPQRPTTWVKGFSYGDPAGTLEGPREAHERTASSRHLSQQHHCQVTLLRLTFYPSSPLSWWIQREPGEKGGGHGRILKRESSSRAAADFWTIQTRQISF